MTEAELTMIKALERRTSRLEHFAFGNGEPGADERLRHIEASQVATSAAVTRVESAVTKLVDQQKAEQNQWLGAKKVFIVASVFLALVTGGSAAWVGTQLRSVLAILP